MLILLWIAAIIVWLNNGSAHHPATFKWWLQKEYSTAIGFHLLTGASWLNQIEFTFLVLIQKVLTGGSFYSVDAVKDHITEFENLWNENPEPFEWIYMRDDLTGLFERLPTI